MIANVQEMELMTIQHVAKNNFRGIKSFFFRMRFGVLFFTFWLSKSRCNKKAEKNAESRYGKGF